MFKDVREPAVAGQFYPDDPKLLGNTIEEYLNKVDKKIEAPILGIIVPHAGYPFSGQTAAYAFKQLKDKTYTTVILIGPTHHYSLEHASVAPFDAYRTPLGTIGVDVEVRDELLKSPYIDTIRAAHLPEHCLEVELPFLQKVLEGEFKIVPMLTGSPTWDNCEHLAKAIVGVIDKFEDRQFLLVASSDFYHGYDYEECKRTTSKAAEYIANFDPSGFYHYYVDNLRHDIHIACGAAPITTVLLVAQRMGADKVELLHITNSGDVTGRKEGYVVGYASFAILKGKHGLSLDEKRHLMKIAKTAIERAVKGEPIPKFDAGGFERLARKQGAFVTINKHGTLRGCIGFIRPIYPLYEAVKEAAIAAALHDPRFPPVTPDELKDLEVEISVLSPMVEVKDINEIKVGRDGLYIVYGGFSGLLLPQVATEYGWDRTTFLEHTCVKAGLPRDCWKEPGVRIFRFTAEVFSEEEIE